MRKEIVNFTVNGKPYEVIVEPNMLTIDVLRDKLGLTGTKYGCGSGDCGAWTVLVNSQPVFSCLTLAVNAREKSIRTIEGLARGVTLYPIQRCA
jgi:aerobic-type carbon monoxide dehydrogenase small subunit (CoxS/CutS family)